MGVELVMPVHVGAGHHLELWLELTAPGMLLENPIRSSGGLLVERRDRLRVLVCLQTGTSRWSVAGRFVVLFSPEFHCEPVQSWVRL